MFEIRRMIDAFLLNNVTFVGEFPSCTVVRLPQKVLFSEGEPYVQNPTNDREKEPSFNVENILSTLHALQKWQSEVYQICRTSATEILMFKANDLDRKFHMEMNNAHPIAYALKGSSLSNEVFGKMVEYVINKCEENGLSVIVTATDGQWHRFGVRNSQDKPLTVYQLQKDLRKQYKSKPKPSLLSELIKQKQAEQF